MLFTLQYNLTTNNHCSSSRFQSLVVFIFLPQCVRWHQCVQQTAGTCTRLLCRLCISVKSVLYNRLQYGKGAWRILNRHLRTECEVHLNVALSLTFHFVTFGDWSLMPVLSLWVCALQWLAVRKWQIRKISDLNNLSDCGPSSNVALYGPFLKYGTLRICHLQTPIFFVICGLFVVCDLRTQFFFADLKLP